MDCRRYKEDYNAMIKIENFDCGVYNFYRGLIMYACVTLVCCLLSWRGVLGAQTSSDIEQSGSLTADEGTNVSLVCDLIRVPEGFGIFWYHANERLYLSFNEDKPVDSRLPDNYAVACISNEEKCVLTIRNVQLRNGGNYFCGIYFISDQPYIAKTIAAVQLSVRQPPYDESPECIQLQPSTDNAPGQEILLRCIVNGGIPPATVVWHLGRSGITEPNAGSFTVSHLLTSSDFGESFICKMTHPSLNEARNCSIIPLPLPSSSTRQPTTVSSMTIMIMNFSTTFSLLRSAKNSNEANTDAVTLLDSIGTVSRKKHSITTFIAIAMIVPVVLIVQISLVIIVIYFTRRKRRKGHSIPKELDNITGRTCTRSADYAEINNLELLENGQKGKLMSEYDLTIQDQISSSNEPKDSVLPVYTKPVKDNKMNGPARSEVAKGQYENLPLSHPHGISQDHDLQNGLMYADLDLPISSSDVAPASEEVTEYADIK